MQSIADAYKVEKQAAYDIMCAEAQKVLRRCASLKYFQMNRSGPLFTKFNPVGDWDEYAKEYAYAPPSTAVFSMRRDLGIEEPIGCKEGTYLKCMLPLWGFISAWEDTYDLGAKIVTVTRTDIIFTGFGENVDQYLNDDATTKATGEN